MSTRLQVILVGVVAAGLAGSIALLDIVGQPSTLPVAPPWPGAVHLDPGAPVVDVVQDPDLITKARSHDGRDPTPAWADIIAVRGPYNQWAMEVAEWPPDPTELAMNRTVLTFGLTFDRDEDGRADLVVSMSNAAPRVGDLRVTVTDLRTGETLEQIGPPYGYPVEFTYPDDAQRQDVGMPADWRTPFALFTFLGGQTTGRRPVGITEASRFYAWTSVAVDGRVVTWDYAPDASWLRILEH